METTTPLDKLPEDIAFPQRVQDRIRFDVAGRRLVFQGHMSLRDYQTLMGIHSDPAFAAAVERLFTQSAGVRPNQRNQTLVVAAVTACLLALTALGVVFIMI
jgi:hypothetical protein